MKKIIYRLLNASDVAIKEEYITALKKFLLLPVEEKHLKDINPELYDRITKHQFIYGKVLDVANDLLDFAEKSQFDGVILPTGSPVLLFKLGEMAKSSHLEFMFVNPNEDEINSGAEMWMAF